MIKADAVTGNTFESMLNELNSVLRLLEAEHGKDSIVSVSHSGPTEGFPKFKAIVVYKTS
ncbi:hypothetical protein IC794_05235 [Acinetobacter seifertii]|uniref:hypothetical protein n=1 Tax=Acinetobacter seifertii TaxID=1530123 RepID=UPI00168B2467|nr:hypothetical protein [Acinetobacter seifertii]QNX13185.1 hypothetical protein IC794_05235 [Acinetobacter seifertii]QNX46365.1 hypothetical protein IC785_06850 [Acinetobacter seifertii]QNX53543.1 hypothetical protein IC783_06460 [Acinetobacter seifertii]QNX53597.1 hypothetical protein IC783_06755 [Acinetobacter seifertii]QNX54775.1 hypothetical protein IC783_22365 [Acinetobacter seifertii]